MSWSHEASSLLLELYRKFPCLYADNHKDYHNEHKRSLALATIVQEIKVLRPNATEQEVQKEFLAMRTMYLAERKKVLDSLHSGTGEEEVYQPTLWYYDALSFLNEYLQISKRSLDVLEAEVQECRDPQSQELDPNVYSSSESDTQYEEMDDDYDFGEDEVLSTTTLGESRSGSSHSNISDTSSSSGRSRSRSPIHNFNNRNKAEQKHGDLKLTYLKQVSKDPGRISDLFSKRQQTLKVKTAEDIFGEFIAAQIKQIKDEDVKLKVQFEIRRLLRDAIKKQKSL